ncbi:ATP-binding protein [Bacillus sp. SCS-153A]|uniref:ATP-binding protein n=1 Tax=Rossellomorea sedimentorum TaxID=3115294 RepID=UPI0039058356
MITKHIPIQQKITMLTFGVVTFTLLIGLIIFVGKIAEMKEEELGQQALIISRTVANLPSIKEELGTPGGWETVQPIVENIRTVNGSDYIVVLDMNRIRYSHPSEELLGTLSSGKDEGRAFAEHSYVSKARGDMGTAMRGFVPIMDENHQQIGVVVVGILLPSLGSIISSLQNELLLIGIITLLFGVIGSWLLAKHIKKETFQLEPHDIAKLLVERTAAFQAMYDGIIAIDKEARITVINEKAKEILSITKDITGNSIDFEVPSSKLPNVLKTKESVHHEEMVMGDKIVLSSRVPIIVNDEVVGAMSVFQDRTEMTQLAEELTGVKGFIEALRVQNHEHQNILHTVAGLIQLEQNEKALEYIFHSASQEENLEKFIMDRIKEDRLSGLLLGKIKRGRELGITVSLDEDSFVSNLPPLVDARDLVIILGNLIENSLYALQESADENKEVHLYIKESDKEFRLEIEDNGSGIASNDLPRIFEKNFTTKGKNGSGIGLYLIKTIVERANGQIKVDSAEKAGTVIQILFPLNGGKKHEHTSDAD